MTIGCPHDVLTGYLLIGLTMQYYSTMIRKISRFWRCAKKGFFVDSEILRIFALANGEKSAYRKECFSLILLMVNLDTSQIIDSE